VSTITLYYIVAAVLVNLFTHACVVQLVFAKLYIAYDDYSYFSSIFFKYWTL